MWLSHPSLKYAHHAHLSASASCGYLTYSRIMPTTPTLLSAVATWLLINPYAHHAQPGVAMWLSHPSLEYAHHAHLSASCGYVAISPIPGVRPPRPPLCLCQLWLHDYLTYPWSTHTTPSQVWLCGYLTHPRSTPTMPTSLPLPAVALSLIPGSCPPRPPFCQLWLRGFSSIPGVRTPRPARCAYLTCPWSTPTTPTSLPAVATWLSHLSLEHTHHARSSTSCGYATNPWSTSNAPSHLPGVAMRLSPVSIEYARRAHPLSAAATQLSHLSLKYTHPTASCGYTTSHLALEYAHHAQPAAGVVAMWPSHFSPGGI